MHKTLKITGFLVSFLLVAAGARADGEIRFTFAPPDGLSWVQKVSSVRDKDLGPAGSQRDEMYSATRVTLTRTRQGWDMVCKPLRVSMKRDGQVVENPVARLLLECPLVYKLDPEGRIVDIEGFGKVLEQADALFPPQVAAQLTDYVNEEALKQKEIAEWNGRIGDFLGRTAREGETWESESPFTLSNGARLTYQMKTTFSRPNPARVLVKQVYDSDARALAAFTNEMTAAVTKDAVPQVSNPGVSGRSSRLLDPRTMLVYEETLKRTIRMEITDPTNGPIPVKLTETRTYKYEYEK